MRSAEDIEKFWNITPVPEDRGLTCEVCENKPAAFLLEKTGYWDAIEEAARYGEMEDW
jgi:hypothetical protein